MVNPNFANEIVKNYRTQQERDNYTALFVQERANARDLGPGSDQFIQQMKAHEERQKALDEKFSQVMGTLNQPLPQPVNPQIDTGHLIALGLSALLGGGNQLPQNINYAQGQAHENAKALDQRNLQQFQLNKEDQLRLLQFLQQQLLDEQNFGQSLTRDQIQQDFQSRIQDKATRDRIDAQEWAQFYNANDPGEATVAGKKLLQKGLISKEEFDMKVQAAGEAAKKAEVKAYFDQMQSVRKSDGSIPDELIPAFKEAEAALKAKYPGVFIPPVVTSETLAAQKQKIQTEQQNKRLKLLEDSLAYRKDIDAKRLAVTIASLQDARERFTITNDRAYLQIWNAAHKAGQSDLPKMKSALKSLDDKIALKQKELARDQNAEQARGVMRLFGGSKASKASAIEKSKNEIIDLQDKRDQLDKAIQDFQQPMPESFDSSQSPQPNWAPIPGETSSNYRVSDNRSGQITDLGNQIKSAFPEAKLERWGPGSIPGSLHKQGLAWDVHNANLPQVAQWAIQQPGIKTVIYNRQVWTPDRGWHKYTGPNPHLDHVHIDMGSDPHGGKETKKNPTPDLNGMAAVGYGKSTKKKPQEGKDWKFTPK